MFLDKALGKFVDILKRDNILAGMMSSPEVSVIVGPHACTNGKTIMVPAQRLDADEIDRENHDELITHEPCHITEGTFEVPLILFKGNKFLHGIHNILEDVRGEDSQERTKYPGLRVDRARFYGTFEKHAERLGTNRVLEASDLTNAVQGALSLLIIKARCKQLGVEAKVKVSEAVQRIYDRTLAPLMDRVIDLVDSYASLGLAKEIMAKLQKDLPKEALQQGQQKQKQQGQQKQKQQGPKSKDEDGESDGESDGDSDEQSDDDGDDGAGKDGDEKKDKKNDKENEEGESDDAGGDDDGDEKDGDEDGNKDDSGDDGDGDEEDGDKDGEPDGKSGDKDDENEGGDKDADGDKDGGDKEKDEDKDDEGDSEDGDGSGEDGESEDEEGGGGGSGAGGEATEEQKEKAAKDAADALDELKTNGIETISDELKEAAIRTADDWEPTKLFERIMRTTDLDGATYCAQRGIEMLGARGSAMTQLFVANSRPRLIRRQRAGRIDMQAVVRDHMETRDDLYKVRRPGAVERAAASFLLDGSGSMLDANRHMFQAQAMSGIAHHLSAAGIPFEVSVFSSGERYMVKAWQEPWRGQAMLRLFPFACGGTPLAEAMHPAVESLLQRKEDKKILVVMTDGMPNGGIAAVEHVQRLIVVLRRVGVVVIGIGIQCRVDHLFGEDSIELPPQAIGEHLVKRLTEILGSHRSEKSMTGVLRKVA